MRTPSFRLGGELHSRVAIESLGAGFHGAGRDRGRLVFIISPFRTNQVQAHVGHKVRPRCRRGALPAEQRGGAETVSGPLRSEKRSGDGER